MLCLPAPTAQAQVSCPAALYPLLSSPSLHISDRDARQLLEKRHLAPHCRDLAADLAQLFFWGGSTEKPDLKRAWHFARLSQRDQRLPSQLRVLAGAFSLAGLNRNMSAAEALRRFERELRADDLLRRDKAYAVLNQLQLFLPRISLEGLPLYENADRNEFAPQAAEGLILNAGLGLVLVANDQGVPTMRWVGESPSIQASRHGDGRMSKAPRRNTGSQYPELFFPVGESRQAQRWQHWDRHSAAGVLYSGFGFANGDYKETRCTATAIASRWLVTAAHCLFASDRDVQHSGQARLEAMRFNAHSAGNPTPIGVEAAWIHRRHRSQDLAANRLSAYSGSDIAVLRLSQALHSVPLTSLNALAGQADIMVRSSGFPKDRSSAGTWINHCRAGLVKRGVGELMDLYAMNCPFSVGQSGSLMTTRSGQPGPAAGAAVGLLSANLSTSSHKSAIFAAFSAELIRDIDSLLSPDGDPQYLVEFPIAGPSLATATDGGN